MYTVYLFYKTDLFVPLIAFSTVVLVFIKS